MSQKWSVRFRMKILLNLLWVVVLALNNELHASHSEPCIKPPRTTIRTKKKASLTEIDLANTHEAQFHANGLHESYECVLPKRFGGARLIGNRYNQNKIQCYIIDGNCTKIYPVSAKYFPMMRTIFAQKKAALHQVVIRAFSSSLTYKTSTAKNKH
jgi:hypothetical protein